MQTFFRGKILKKILFTTLFHLYPNKFGSKMDNLYLPGRKSAESMRSSRLVAPSTNIC